MNEWLTPEVLAQVWDLSECMADQTRAKGIPVPQICIGCNKMQPCRSSNVGPICRPCFQGSLDNKDGRKISIPPPAGTRGFIIKGGKDYITIHGVLQFFMQKSDAEKTLEMLRKEFPLPDARIEEEDATLSFLYCATTPSLRMIAIESIDWERYTAQVT